MKIHHVNFGAMRAIPNDVNESSIVHCLILEDPQGLALVDTGLGLAEMQFPKQLFGEALLNGWGFFPDPRYAALTQLTERGIKPSDIKHVLLTHADVDHAGGLVDLPRAQVHLTQEERDNLDGGNPRYLFNQFDHTPNWQTYGRSADEWMGLPSRPLDLGFDGDVRMIFLPGHTHGHCGYAIKDDDGRWTLFHADVYYRRQEMDDDDAPVVHQAKHSADDAALRAETKAKLKTFLDEHPNVTHFSTHDLEEFPLEVDAEMPTQPEIEAAGPPAQD